MADIFPGTLILATDPGDLGRNCLGPHRTDWLKRPPRSAQTKAPPGATGLAAKGLPARGLGARGQARLLKTPSRRVGCTAQGQRRLGSRYRSGRSPDWLQFRNPDAPAVKREAEEDWR